jgi:hypothetical protein
VENSNDNKLEIRTFHINLTGNPNSCLVKILGHKYRTLVDTGAEVSLMHRRVYDSLKIKPKLKRHNVHLQSAGGDSLEIDGCINITLKIGGTEMSQMFYVVRNLNRNLILGTDWLIQNGVRIYFDLGCLRIGDKTYVNLEQDIHVSSIVRTKYSTVIKPQTTKICYGKVKHNPDLESNNNYEISFTEKSFLANEPGLIIVNTISKLSSNRSIPFLIANNSNKTIKIARHAVVAKIDKISDQKLKNINSIIKDSESNFRLNMEDLVVPSEFKGDIENLILQNQDLFASKDSELGHTDTVRMKIDTGDTSPIKLRPYRTPMKNRQVIDKTVDEMLDANIIKRSRSPWSFPVVIVDKKDGTKRFCVDFRKLNKVTKKNSYPLPLIDDILALLGKAKYFTSLDLKSGYWQVLMDENDKEKTAFACHRGLFEFNVMPFGLSNAPAIFQELMSIVLQDCSDFATAYLDDILIFSSSLEEHLSHLRLIFSRLRQHGLKLKLKKCSFLQEETNYLGFVIDTNGVKPDPKKVAAIRSLPAPTCVREVRSFIGMCSYYRRFIPNFSQIADCIVALTKKNARFKWLAEHEKAFKYLKDSLSVVPLLSYPDPNKPYILYTDASDTCIGACLTQTIEPDDSFLPNVVNEKPIYYLSHKLSKSQCKWSTVEKEAYAIHFALQKLDYYLHNSEFIIKTDHKPLKYLLESPMQNKKIQLWALSMAGYNCRVEYIAGTTNTCADLLSRLPSSSVAESSAVTIDDDVCLDVNENSFEVNVIDSTHFCPKEFASCDISFDDSLKKPDDLLPGFNMIAEQKKDDVLTQIKDHVLRGDASKDIQKKYVVLDDVLYYLSDPDGDTVFRLYVPNHLKALVIKQYHDENGHMGVQKTFDSIRLKYFWPNLFKEIYSYVSTCTLCQTRSLRKIRQPLQETDIPPYPMAKLSLDVSGPYPTSLSGNKYIIAFVDWFSGWPEAFAVPDKSADTVAHLLLNEIFPRFGCPLQIVTDNGTENVNKVVRETMERLNISHVLTSVYHPQSNAKVERFHRTLHDILAKRLTENQQLWDLQLAQALAAIRFSVSESSRFSPYFLLYNRDVVLPVDNLMKPRRKYQGEELHQIALQEQHKTFQLVRRYLKKAKKRQAKYADRGTKQVEFKVNDPVYYKNNQRKGKLDIKWKPYYRIIEKNGPASYVIKNQLNGSTSRVHAELLRLADIDEWDIPTQENGKPLRKPQYVIPPEVSDSETTSDSEEEMPLAQLAKRYRNERENSDEEDDIPLMELAKRIRSKEQTHFDESDVSDSHNDTSLSKNDNLVNESLQSHGAENNLSESAQLGNDNFMSSDDAMSVNEVKLTKNLNTVKLKRKQKKVNKGGSDLKMKRFFKALSDLF